MVIIYCMTPLVQPNLDYLKDLQSQGHVLVDVEVSSHGPEKYLVTVHTSLKQRVPFEIHTSKELFFEHHKAAVAFMGFGPLGLSNVIYAEARNFSNTRGIPPEQVQISLSEECLTRVGEHMKMWMHYGLVFIVNPSIPGLGYSIKAIPPAQN